VDFEHGVRGGTEGVSIGAEWNKKIVGGTVKLEAPRTPPESQSDEEKHGRKEPWGGKKKNAGRHRHEAGEKLGDHESSTKQ